MDGFRPVPVTRVREGRQLGENDCVATEEPLEVRLHGHPFAVIMRTPGSDRELVAGFLFSERVLATTRDIVTIAHCSTAASEQAGNIIDVTLADASSALDQLVERRRRVATNSSCGMCGRVTLESVRAEAPTIQSTLHIESATLTLLPERLRQAQSVFDMTGGLHAAGLFTPDGHFEQVAEDVGRHNAVDKIIGAMLFRDALPLSESLLCVSGRTSFEIVQKAHLAGIPLVAAISAPSTLAIELADQAGITLVGFVRDGACSIYTHAFRVK